MTRCATSHHSPIYQPHQENIISSFSQSAPSTPEKIYETAHSLFAISEEQSKEFKNFLDWTAQVIPLTRGHNPHILYSTPEQLKDIMSSALSIDSPAKRAEQAPHNKRPLSTHNQAEFKSKKRQKQVAAALKESHPKSTQPATNSSGGMGIKLEKDTESTQNAENSASLSNPPKWTSYDDELLLNTAQELDPELIQKLKELMKKSAQFQSLVWPWSHRLPWTVLAETYFQDKQLRPNFLPQRFETHVIPKVLNQGKRPSHLESWLRFFVAEHGKKWSAASKEFYRHNDYFIAPNQMKNAYHCFIREKTPKNCFGKFSNTYGLNDPGLDDSPGQYFV